MSVNRHEGPSRESGFPDGTSQIAQLDVEPGELPATMAAWVIRAEREGEPTEAFQLEEMEVPEPGAFEVTVRVMAAGVNFNNVWAALGKPISVFRHREEDHHIGGSDASGVVWKVGEGVTRFKPGDEVVVHCNQASYEDPEVHGLDPLAAPSQRIWGYETTWGSFAQFCRVQAQQLLPKPAALTWEEAASYGLTFFTAYRMLVDQARLQEGHRVLIWGGAGGLGGFATPLCRLAGGDSLGGGASAGKGGMVKSPRAGGHIGRQEDPGEVGGGGGAVGGGEGRTGQVPRGGRLHRPQRVPGDDAGGWGDVRRGEGALQGVAPLLQGRRGEAGRRARHRLRARRPCHLSDLDPRGQAVRHGRH